MKKLAIIISCLISVLSFSVSAESDKTLEAFQELCAKEKDPIKRQRYCHILDRNAQSPIILSELNSDTETV